VIRGVILLILIAIIVLVIVFNAEVKENFTSLIEWISKNAAIGSVILALVYIVATVFFIPGSILTLGAGYAFRLAFKNTGIAVLVGSLSVFVGAFIGACLAFLIGRYILRD
jgi:uncharacterized membrane protein YdjX (TVP38/TMEM64 family)